MNRCPQTFSAPFLKRFLVNAAVMVPCTAQPSGPATPKPWHQFFKSQVLELISLVEIKSVMQEADGEEKLMSRKVTSSVFFILW